jgi:hypothetical protein
LLSVVAARHVLPTLRRLLSAPVACCSLPVSRYSDLKPEDFMIESVYTDDDGSKKICLVKRDKSFARVDIPVTTVSMVTIAKDFNREVVVCSTLTDFKNKFNRKEVQGKLLHLVWRNALGYCVKNEEALGLEKFNELMGDIFFEKSEFYRESETFIDKKDFTSGGVISYCIEIKLFLN